MTNNADIAAVLETLLLGSADESAVRRMLKARPPSPSLETIWANLEHFLSDADIRASDDAYRAMQEGELRKLILWLREDAPVEQIGRVNFLRPA